MNNVRRKQIEVVQRRVARLKEDAESIRARVEQIRDAEQEYFDAMSDSSANSERGEQAEQSIEQLQQAVDELESFIENELDAYLEAARA